MVFSPKYFPGQLSSLQGLPPPLPSLYLSPQHSPISAGPKEVTTEGTQGPHPTASAPLKGTAAPRGQKEVSPRDGRHPWHKEKEVSDTLCPPLCSATDPEGFAAPPCHPLSPDRHQGPEVVQPERCFLSPLIPALVRMDVRQRICGFI